MNGRYRFRQNSGRSVKRWLLAGYMAFVCPLSVAAQTTSASTTTSNSLLGGGSLSVIFIGAAIAIVYLTNFRAKRRRGRYTPPDYDYSQFDGLRGFLPPPDGTARFPKDYTQDIASAIAIHDPLFNPQELLARAANDYRRLQQGYADGDVSFMESIASPTLFQKHHNRLQTMQAENLAYAVSDIDIYRLYLQCYERHEQTETLTIFFSVRQRDYWYDRDSGEILDGDADIHAQWNYCTLLERTSQDGSREWIWKGLILISDILKLETQGVILS